MQPAQHALGALLLERRELFDEANLIRVRLNLAAAGVDVSVNAFFACRLQHHCCD
jgi:hypothetical protein